MSKQSTEPNLAKQTSQKPTSPFPLKTEDEVYKDAGKDMAEMKEWADQDKIHTKNVVPQQTKKSVPKAQAVQPKPKQQQVEQTRKQDDMAKTRSTTTKPQTTQKKRKPNLLLWITIAIVVIPCLILAWILLGSRENANQPVEGDRFVNSLDPAITEEDLEALKSELVFEEADKVEINLRSATLRIMIDGKDDCSQETLINLRNAAYDKVVAKLPVDTYFTNKTSGKQIIKMYDLEISAYNFIPENEEQKANAIHVNRVKNAAFEEVVDQVLTQPKDEETSEGILHPDTSTPPQSEGTN